MAFSKTANDCVDYSETSARGVTTKTVDDNLVMTYSGGDICQGETHHALEMTMECDKEMEVGDIVAKGFFSSDGKCTTKVTLASRHACPKLSATPFVEFLAEHPWATGIILIVLGTVVNFFGRKFI